MPHYSDAAQTSPLRERRITFTARQRTFTAVTGSGVFSKDGLDNATKLLLEAADLRGDERVLDLGCGWGPIGLVLRSCHPRLPLVMSDVNLRAVSLARRNVPDADVRASDGFARIPERFDVILTNPPYAAGRETCYRLLEESYDHLEEGGSLLVVARHQKGGKMLERRMKDLFGCVETVKKGGGFRVYRGTRQS